jgi:hypothetical protein
MPPDTNVQSLETDVRNILLSGMLERLNSMSPPADKSMSGVFPLLVKCNNSKCCLLKHDRYMKS